MNLWQQIQCRISDEQSNSILVLGKSLVFGAPTGARQPQVGTLEQEQSNAATSLEKSDSFDSFHTALEDFPEDLQKEQSVSFANKPQDKIFDADGDVSDKEVKKYSRYPGKIRDKAVSAFKHAAQKTGKTIKSAGQLVGEVYSIHNEGVQHTGNAMKIAGQKTGEALKSAGKMIMQVHGHFHDGVSAGFQHTGNAMKRAGQKTGETLNKSYKIYADAGTQIADGISAGVQHTGKVPLKVLSKTLGREVIW